MAARLRALDEQQRASAGTAAQVCTLMLSIEYSVLFFLLLLVNLLLLLFMVVYMMLRLLAL